MSVYILVVYIFIHLMSKYPDINDAFIIHCHVPFIYPMNLFHSLIHNIPPNDLILIYNDKLDTVYIFCQVGPDFLPNTDFS